MKKLFSKYVWLQLILSILLLFGGTLTIVFAIKDYNKDGATLQNALNIIAAVILFLFGGFSILASFVFERKSAVTYGIIYGSASIAMGVLLCSQELILLNYLVLLLAIFFIVVGSIELIKAIVMTIKVKPKVYILILAYAISVIFIAGGILSLIFKDNVKTAFCVIAGVLLFLLGVYELVIGVKEMIAQVKGAPEKEEKHKDKRRKNEEQEAKQDPVQEEKVPEQEIKEIDYTTNKIEEKKTDE